jgi:hypothetical protein
MYNTALLSLRNMCSEEETLFVFICLVVDEQVHLVGIQLTCRRWGEPYSNVFLATCANGEDLSHSYLSLHMLLSGMDAYVRGLLSLLRVCRFAGFAFVCTWIGARNKRVSANACSDGRPSFSVVATEGLMIPVCISSVCPKG